MNARMALLAAFALATTMLGGCDSQPLSFETQLSQVRTELTYLKDEEGRYVHLRGINVGGNVKVPFVSDDEPFSNGRFFTYVGRPFPLEDADRHFALMRQLGFNAIRLLFLWEAIFPERYGEPDEEYLDYFESLIEKARDNGLYVLINAHENLWGRHLYAGYNENAPGLKGDIENMLLSLFPPHTNKVVGDGAPLWATKACLPEKNFDSEFWGIHHLVGTLAKDEDGVPGSDVLYAIELAAPFLGIDVDDDFKAILDGIEDKLVGAFPYTDTCDMIPLSGWWENTVISLDIEKCYAAFYAGDSVYPSRCVDTRTGENVLCEDHVDDPAVMNLKEYFQSSFSDAWVEVAKRAAKMCGDERCYPNIIGYDLMNEPAAAFYMLAVVAAYFELGLEPSVKDLLNFVAPIQLGDDVVQVIDGLLPWLGDPSRGPCEEQCDMECDVTCNFLCGDLCGGDANCEALCAAQTTTCDNLCGNQETACVELCRDPDRDLAGSKLLFILKYLEMLPPDPDGETRAEWGMSDLDLFGVIGLIDAFDVFQLQPVFQRVGNAIEEADPDAIIWIEPTTSGSLQGETYMTVPEGVEQVVYAPHWYPDIYPFLGFNQPSRDFSPDEIRFRDYSEDLRTSAKWASYTLSNVPTVFGEFGTYWNYKYKGEDWEEEGYLQSRRNDYQVSKEFLDNYYEAYEKLFMSNFLWCYTDDNTMENGDGWNKEDFSILDENQEPRGAEAYSRPYPKKLSGKPISMHFYSELHYYDPDKGTPDPRREFELRFASKETNAPTIIFVPEIQYPDGFYVWLSDGWAAWDAANRELYYHPERDEPEWEHWVRIRPPIEGQDITGWNYYVEGDHVVAHGR